MSPKRKAATPAQTTQAEETPAQTTLAQATPVQAVQVDDDPTPATKRQRNAPTKKTPQKPKAAIRPSPREGKLNQGMGNDHLEQRPDLQRVISAFTAPESLRFLMDSEDEDDYKVRLHYFFAQVFFVTRDLDSQERQAVFNNTLPGFACGPGEGPAARAAVLSEHFDTVYNKFVAWFMRSVEKLGRRFLDSEAGKSWLDERERSK